MPPQIVIGLTGNIACGKSTVLRILAVLGAVTIDADTVYHELIAPGSALQASIRDRFGSGVVAADGTIDRAALGRIVFNNAAALADLDALTHPAVVADIRQRLSEIDARVVVIDAVKLVESGLADDCDQLWVVTCPPGIEIDRLMGRNGLDRADAERRVASQPPATDKVARAAAVINNGGDLNETRAQVAACWRTLCETASVSVDRG
jgi:dephospho-CoA kinase